MFDLDIKTGGAGVGKAKPAASRKQEKPSQKPEPAAVSADAEKAEGDAKDNATNETKGN